MPSSHVFLNQFQLNENQQRKTEKINLYRIQIITNLQTPYAKFEVDKHQSKQHLYRKQFQLVFDKTALERVLTLALMEFHYWRKTQEANYAKTSLLHLLPAIKI